MNDRFGTRVSRSWAVLVALAIIGACWSPLNAQTTDASLPPTPELLAKIPEDLRQPAAQWLRGSAQSHAEWARLDPAELRYRLIINLESIPQACDVILDTLPRESLRTKITLLHNMSFDSSDRWCESERLPHVIESLVADDPDPKVVDAALDALAKIRLKPLKAMLDKRIAADTARAGRSDAAALEERWINLERGVMLPRFLQEPPPVFTVKAARDSVRWVAFGDFGSGKDSQQRTASAIAREHARKPFDLGITLGDNFYPEGMEGVRDPRWKLQWEDLYGSMRITFYPSLGNHDWYGTDSPAAEVLYSHESSTWHMPATYYTYVAGPVQFFVLDSDAVSQKQLTWLEAELAKSKMTWRVVYGHYPMYAAAHSGIYDEVAPFLKPVYEVLEKHHVDLYIAGHHHSLQHTKPRDGIEFVISGGGGMSTSGAPPTTPNALFASSVFGFTVFEADRNHIRFSHRDWDGGEIYRYSFTKHHQTHSDVPTRR